MKLSAIQVFYRLIPYFMMQKTRLFFSLISVVALTAVHLLNPWILRFIIDSAVVSGNEKQVVTAVLGFIMCVLAGAVISYFQVIVMTRAGCEIVGELKKRVFQHILSQGMRFFDVNQPGKLMSRTEDDSEKMLVFFSHMAAGIFTSILMLAGIATVIALEQPDLMKKIVMLLPFTGAAVFFYMRYMRQMHTKIRSRNSELSGYVAEYIQGVPLLQLYSREEKAVEILQNYNQAKFDMEKKTLFMDHCVFWSFFHFLSETVSVAVLFWFGCQKVVEGTMTVGSLIMYLELIRRFFGPLLHMMNTISEMQGSIAAAGRIMEILDNVSDVPDSGNALEKVRLEQSIEFRHVIFAYKEESVLKDVSFQVRKGQKIALVGASGSGKTTCVSLLLRFYDPVSGSICIDGKDIREFSLKNLRQDISLVLQEIYLFPGTVLDNLRLFDQSISEEKVTEAAKIIGAHEFIMEKPLKYQTILSERGSNLSQGERQLLSFTRALVKNPEILVLDEATSSVDVITEKKLQEALSKLLENRTAVIIAHRLSTVRKADRILVFDHGRVAECGTHDSLIENEGIYKKLCLLQAAEGDL